MSFRPSLRRALTLTMIVPVAVAGALAGCGDDAASSPPAGCTPVVAGKVTLVARNLQWNTECLRVPGPGKVTFVVELEDEGVEHDLEVYGRGRRAKTPLEAGPTTQTLEFDFPEPGTYRFVCTIHAQMEGTIYVDAPA